MVLVYNEGPLRFAIVSPVIFFAFAGLMTIKNLNSSRRTRGFKIPHTLVRIKNTRPEYSLVSSISVTTRVVGHKTNNGKNDSRVNLFQAPTFQNLLPNTYYQIPNTQTLVKN
jgi:hypothetical protein